MLDRELISQKMRDHFESVWRQGDAWDLESSEYERNRYANQTAILGGRRFKSALEAGCGSGQFTCLLSNLAERVLAVDISSQAVDRARQHINQNGKTNIEFLVADIMQFDSISSAGPWDLIVMSEMIYCLGWLYPFFDVAWLASQIFTQTCDGGRLLLANTLGQDKDWLLRPWLIHSYRDLFRNVGYQLESERIFRGVKNGTSFEVLMLLFVKLSPTESAVE